MAHREVARGGGLNPLLIGWDAEVEKAARKMERKSHAGGKSAPRLIQDASIPLVVFEGATLSPELKQKLARLTALSQKTVIAWAELRQQRNRWRAATRRTNPHRRMAS